MAPATTPSRHALTTCLATLFVMGQLPAQPRVSPAFLANTEGNAANTYPWNFAGRYQQVHGDLRGQALAIRGLEFRRDGVQPGTMAERRLDCEIWLSEGRYVEFAPAFAANHRSGMQRTQPRRLVDLPRLPAPITPPAPWLVAFPFDAPFAYSGVEDLVWELRVHANTVTSVTYHTDAYSGAAVTDVNTSKATSVGTGCTASGNTQRMQADACVRTFQAADRITASLWCAHAPRSQASAMFLGSQPVDLQIPGLCTAFRVGGSTVVIPGTTDAEGLHFVQASVPFDAALVHASLIHQVVTVDPGRLGPLQLSASDLAVWAIPAKPAPGGAVPVARIWVNGPASWPIGTIDATNFALVTGFAR